MAYYRKPRRNAKIYSEEIKEEMEEELGVSREEYEEIREEARKEKRSSMPHRRINLNLAAHLDVESHYEALNEIREESDSDNSL